MVEVIRDGLDGLVALDAENLLLPHAAGPEGAADVDLDAVALVAPRPHVHRDILAHGEQQAPTREEDALADVAGLRQELETHELEAHERVDFAVDERLDRVIIVRGDLRGAEECLDLRGRDRGNQQLTLLFGLGGGEEEAGAPEFGDGQVGVGGSTRLHVINGDLGSSRKRDDGGTGLTAIGVAEGGLDDHAIHLAAEAVDSILRVGRRGIGKHAELVLLVDHVGPVEVAQGHPTAVMRSADQRRIAVTRGVLDGFGGPDAVVEVEFRILGLDAHEWAQARSLLLELDLNVRLVGVHESSIYLKGHGE